MLVNMSGPIVLLSVKWYIIFALVFYVIIAIMKIIIII